MVKEKSINLFGIFVQKALLIRSARRKKKIIILSMSLVFWLGDHYHKYCMSPPSLQQCRIKLTNRGNDNCKEYLDFSFIFAGEVIKLVVFQVQI